MRGLACVALLVIALPGCQVDDIADPYYSISDKKAETPLSAETKSLIIAKGMALDAPIMVRIIKEEDKLEVWKQKPDGRFAHLKDYEICAWSGEFGRKKQEGDRQAPEGFYDITPALMNPYSSYFLAFNTGFPNSYDRAHDFTGSHLMVHGACSSRGCYSMTDEHIGEIYALAREAFAGGQKAFQLQAIPFRLTPENLAPYYNHSEYDFWLNLKEGMDHFRVTHMPPEIGVCDRRYVYNVELEEGDRLDAVEDCPQLSHAPRLAQGLRAIDKVDGPKLAKLVEREAAKQARQIARAARQEALEHAFSFGASQASQQNDDQPAEIASTAEPDITDTSETGPTASFPIPRPRPGSSATPTPSQVAADAEQNHSPFGRGFVRFMGRFGLGASD